MGTTILDSNGNLERVTSYLGYGDYGSAAPAWSAASGGTTTDNSGPNQVVWTNLGTVTPVAGPITFPGLTDGASDSASTGTSMVAAEVRRWQSWRRRLPITGARRTDFTSGVYQSFTVDSNGVVTAQFSNNRTSTIGQVAVATVANLEGLTASGGVE